MSHRTREGGSSFTGGGDGSWLLWPKGDCSPVLSPSSVPACVFYPRQQRRAKEPDSTIPGRRNVTDSEREDRNGAPRVNPDLNVLVWGKGFRRVEGVLLPDSCTQV